MFGEALPEPLRRALARVADQAGAFARTVVFAAETGSTNDDAARLAAGGAPHGTLVVAGAQTAGRGRMGREWYSPPGAGLYFSLVLRPERRRADARHDRAIRLLTLAAGVAVAEGIERAQGLRPQLKWPNDLVVATGGGARAGGRWRKLGGILAEGSTIGEAVQFVILGVGINVRADAVPPALAERATALEVELGRPVDGEEVLAQTVASLAAWWARLERGAFEQVLEAWRALAPSASGCPVRVSTPTGPLEGVTSGIDADGALLVSAGERVWPVAAGEVEWR
jgi:BirA family biotin operon repressor/biotin-[acetyl-CoA-carboxylase] ligase